MISIYRVYKEANPVYVAGARRSSLDNDPITFHNWFVFGIEDNNYIILKDGIMYAATITESAAREIALLLDPDFEKLRVEIGTYRTRDGELVKILHKRGDHKYTPWLGIIMERDEINHWCDTGAWLINGNKHSFDLVERVS